MLSVLYGNLPSGVLDREVYILELLPMVLKEPGKTHSKVTMSWAAAVEGGVIDTLGFMG